MNDTQKDRLLELLADQALFGLNAAEQMELGRLKNDFPEWETNFSFELAAAAVSLRDLDASEELPANLREKILARTEEFFAAPEESQKSINFLPRVEKANVSSVAESDAAPDRRFWQWFGWGLAAAACVALAIGLWSARNQNQPEIVVNPEVAPTPEAVKTPETFRSPETTPTPDPMKTPNAVKSPEVEKTPETIGTPETARTPGRPAATPETIRTPAPALTTVQKREQLMASAPDVVRTNWTSAKGDGKMSGDVVWSSAQQEGYVRLRGMPILDRNETYQLWIIDDERKTPVSAGLFKTDAAGEIIIPLNAQSRIAKPKQFAISKEKAGGVSVTKPDRIVAIAKT